MLLLVACNWLLAGGVAIRGGDYNNIFNSLDRSAYTSGDVIKAKIEILNESSVDVSGITVTVRCSEPLSDHLVAESLAIIRILLGYY